MQIIVSHHIFCVSGNLKTITVYHCAQIIQLILMCCHGAFPDRPFRQLSISHDYIHAAVFVIHFGCLCHSYADRKSMSQRTGIHLDTRQFIIRMANIFRTKFAEIFQDIFFIQKSFFRKHCIVCLHRMTLTEYKQISVRIFWIFCVNVHLIKIQLYQNFHHAHVTADMPCLSGTDNVYGVSSKLISQCF